MKTLEYYSADGTHTVFEDYTIDEKGGVKNVKIEMMMSRRENAEKYNIVNVRHKGRRCTINLGRAIASTFLGKPPSLQHTADHIDQDPSNDVLENIRWASKREQNENRDMPSQKQSAVLIEKDGIEHTAYEWTKIFKKRSGEEYTTTRIQQFARKKLLGFRYKTFQNLPGEVWKPVKDSKNNKGAEWFISSKSRMKYKTVHAEHVLTANDLHKSGGYPLVCINRKQWKCHELAFMTFRPNEYAARMPDDIILHKNDDRLDFNPFRLRLGSRSENGIDAHDNGKYDGTKSSRKPVASYIDGKLDKEHKSILSAVRYLKDKYPTACLAGVQRALYNGSISYGRAWKFM
ncbi:hypothetical protein ATCVBr0604L_689R [Acanthocystis turfacea Chlorella virus Br0604L]|nr:hypothetical protein ATCVBr0604L_689R [Acanthocystis turfacea Chlorella virus Br0604L]